MPTARLIIDSPAEGAWNMAVDEALLESAVASDTVTLRFYEWTPATLSLGYFQAYDERAGHTASLDCPIVRRSTGGGAIVHDQELTYSIIVPVSGRFHPAATALYDAMHQSLVSTLAQLGVQASLYRTPELVQLGEAKPPEPFLCFQRRAVGDVIIDGQKVAGSAQRRHAGTVLQHGSILLRRSANAPELPGICDLAGVDLSARHLAELWLQEVAPLLSLEPRLDVLSEPELALARKVQIDKFQCADWTRKR